MSGADSTGTDIAGKRHMEHKRKHVNNRSVKKA